MSIHPRAHGATVHDTRRDRGQAALLVVCMSAVLLVAVLVAAASMGRTILDRQRAQTAADAAALAALVGGREDAAEFAERHGGSLVSWRVGPTSDDVTVVVRVGESTATARATDAP